MRSRLDTSPDTWAHYSLARKARLLAGVALILIGLPLYLLPIPLGLVTLVPGLVLLAHSSGRFRHWLAGVSFRLQRRFPGVWKKVRPLVRRSCPECDPSKK